MNQIFSRKLDIKRIYNYLKNIGNKQLDKFLIFNDIIFKKKIDIINNFYTYLLDYYFESKKFYLTRDKTFKNFCTILRQLCKYLNIPFTSKLQYNKTKYSIYYVLILK